MKRLSSWWLVAASLCGVALAGCTSSSGGHPSLPTSSAPPSVSVSVSVSRPVTTTTVTSTTVTSTTRATSSGSEVAAPTTADAPTTAAPATTAPPITAAPTTASPITSPPATTPATTAPSTTSSTTSTTAAPLNASSSKGVPWGWVIALLVVAALAVLIALLVHRNTRAKAIRAWQQESGPAVDSAHLTLSLLPASGQDIADRAQWQSVRQRVEEAAQLLDRASSRAPTEQGARAASRSAETLRGLGFALESNLLLREASVAPTGQQLADADATARQRRYDAEAALAELDRAVGRTSVQGQS